MTNTIEEVRGDQVIIRFDHSKCIHSRHCVLDRPDIFVPNVEGAWIYPNKATPEEVAALAENCPSGAITFERLDGGANESAPVVNLVHIRENDPLAVHAPTLINGVDSGLRLTLCRCGASKNKPYCDSSHAVIGFHATGEPPTKESEALAVRNGPLKVTPTLNGPLMVQGSLEVVSGTGRTIDRTTETFLCRCGGSSNKPFCDGTHLKNGFKSE